MKKCLFYYRETVNQTAEPASPAPAVIPVPPAPSPAATPAPSPAASPAPPPTTTTIQSATRDDSWLLDGDEVQLTYSSLGRGAWGNVYRGLFRGSRVAIKRIHALILSDYNRERFLREVRMSWRCRHPNIVTMIGATVDRSPLMVMELMDLSLRAMMEQRHLTPEEVVTLALDVARGLNYLHLSRPEPIIHRDLSSANVLLFQQGAQWRAKISDLGSACFQREQMSQNPGAVIYAAPEAQTNDQSPKVSRKKSYTVFN